jgi:hypothetical protein
VSLMEKFSDRKFVFASCAFIYLVNVSGMLLLSFGEPCFNLLYWVLTVPTTLRIVLACPSIRFARQLILCLIEHRMHVSV